MSREPDESKVRFTATDVHVTSNEVFFGAPPEVGATVVKIVYDLIGPDPRLDLEAAFPAEVLFGESGSALWCFRGC